MTATQSAGWSALAGAGLAACLVDPRALLAAFDWTISSIFVALVTLRTAAILMALAAAPARRGRWIDEHWASETPAQADDGLPALTFLVPLYHEANVAAGLVAALRRLRYPPHKLEALFLVEADDAETFAALRAADLPQRFQIKIVPLSEPRTKPKALNYGLAFARGDLVAVFDAEDRPHPDQPRAAAAAFADGADDLAVVQAPLDVDNGDAGWLAQQFEIEYAAHFRVWLPFIARLRLPIALGGTSNYFRVDRLRAAGGWDPFNVTEDADIGLRLAAYGWTAQMIAPATREEAPIRFGHWLAQRTRWLKGHLQTWIVLSRYHWPLVRTMGFTRYLGAHLVLGGALLAAAVHGPIVVTILVGAFVWGGVPADWHGVLLGAGFSSAVAAGLVAMALRRPILACLSSVAYWPLMSLALLRALYEIKTRPHFWAKTPHGVSRRDGRGAK